MTTSNNQPTTTNNQNAQAQSANKETKPVKATMERDGKEITITWKGEKYITAKMAHKLCGLSEERIRSLGWNESIRTIETRVGNRARVLFSVTDLSNRGHNNDEVIILRG